jgi:hypothetical protein
MDNGHGCQFCFLEVSANGGYTFFQNKTKRVMQHIRTDKYEQRRDDPIPYGNGYRIIIQAQQQYP